MYLLDASASRIECIGRRSVCLSVGRGLGRGLRGRHLLGSRRARARPVVDLRRSTMMSTSDCSSSRRRTSLSLRFRCAGRGRARREHRGLDHEQDVRASSLRREPGRGARSRVWPHSPGKLADPNVSAALVVLTDGGDNCSGSRTARHRAAPRSERRQATPPRASSTYVVRFGKPENKTPELEEQLKAIAVNGGTATMDPKQPEPPSLYRCQGRDLARCGPRCSSRIVSRPAPSPVAGLPADADKNLANLYLNGELIPFDKARRQGRWLGLGEPRADRDSAVRRRLRSLQDQPQDERHRGVRLRAGPGDGARIAFGSNSRRLTATRAGPHGLRSRPSTSLARSCRWD